MRPQTRSSSASESISQARNRSHSGAASSTSPVAISSSVAARNAARDMTVAGRTFTVPEYRSGALGPSFVPLPATAAPVETRGMQRRPSGPTLRALLAAIAIAALAVPLVVLRALPPLELDAGGLGWVIPILSAGLLAAAGLAMVASLNAGLRTGRLSALLMAGASAALAGGALVRLTGPMTMTLAITVAGGMLLAAALAERFWALVSGRGNRVAAAAALMVVAEAAVVGGLLPPLVDTIEPLRTWLLGGAAIAAVLAALVVVANPMAPAAASFAAGAAALAVARGEGAEMVFGLVSLAAGALLSARAGIGAVPERIGEADEILPDLAVQLSEGVLRFDGHLRLRSWNPAAATLLGLDESSAGARLEDLLGVSLAQLPAATETVLHRTPLGGLDLSIHRDGSAITVVIRDPGTSADAERLGRELRGTIEELLQARRTIELQRAEVERMASTDPLTGVASRGAIIDRLRMETAQARRYQHPVTIVLIDVDRFGEINSAHGIDAGDAVLREVALRVRLRVRAADAIGRSGSDGLLAILPHSDEGGGAAFADALRRRIGQRPISVGDVEVTVTVSLGVAVMRPGEDLDFDGLMARAEEALASARGAGGDRIALDRLHGLARLEHRPPAVPDDPAGEQHG